MESLELAISKVVNLLTAITWWLDVRFSKSSIWFANLSFFTMETLRFIKSLEFVEIIASFLAAYIMTFIVYSVFRYFGFIEKSQKTPNKNIQHAPKVVLGCILGSIFILILAGDLMPGFMYLIYYLILCTEKITPREKTIRIKRNRLARNN